MSRKIVLTSLKKSGRISGERIKTAMFLMSRSASTIIVWLLNAMVSIRTLGGAFFGKIKSNLSGHSKIVRAVRKNGDVVTYPSCSIHPRGKYVVLTRYFRVYAILVTDYFERIEKKQRIVITQDKIRPGMF